MEKQITLSQKQSDRIRNLHRLSEIGDAQKGLDALEGEAKAALAAVLKKHGMRIGEMTLTLSLGKMPSLFEGKTGPNGYLTASLVVE